MNPIEELAKSVSLVAVYKTPCGKINVRVQGITLHFTQDAFMHCANMIAQAKNKMMDQGLNDLLEGNGRKE
jgi:hypothetical protein